MQCNECSRENNFYNFQHCTHKATYERLKTLRKPLPHTHFNSLDAFLKLFCLIQVNFKQKVSVLWHKHTYAVKFSIYLPFFKVALDVILYLANQSG